MKRQLSKTICGLKFIMEKNNFEGLKSSSGKKRNDFVAKPINNSRSIKAELNFDSGTDLLGARKKRD